MNNCSNVIDKTKKTEFEKISDFSDRHFGQRKDVIFARGYYSDGTLSFFASYDKDNNYSVTFYQEGGETRANETFFSDMEDEIAFLPEGDQKKHRDARSFIQVLKTLEKQKNNSSRSKSLAESLKEGVCVSLSQESRLSFAPSIEELKVRTDKDGVLHIVGASKDGKQSVDFSFKDGIVSLELTDGKRPRSYNNKFGEFTYRYTDTPDQTRYRDHNKGEKYAKEFGRIMDKLKAAHQQRSNTQGLSGHYQGLGPR